MKKAIFLTGILLLATTWLAAQYGNAPTWNPSDNTASQQTTIRGCLQGTPGKFTLTDASGKTWNLQGKEKQLEKHSGHEVALTGTPSGSMSGGSTGSSAETSSTGTNEMTSFQVSKLHHISSQCTSGGGNH